MLNKSLFRLLAVATSVVLVGCASPASSVNMTMRSADSTEARAKVPDWAQKSMAVKDVTGGKETNPAWMSSVSSSAFRAALEESLRALNMHAVGGEARYELVAHLNKLDQPFGGFNMTVTASVTYELVERGSGKTVWQQAVVTPYTASVSDAFVGSERLKLANEGAIRTNISQLVQRLQALNASDVAVR